MKIGIMNRKLTTLDMEIALARHFNYRQNIIVPNVSWGFGLLYEADMLIITPRGYITEIEIKITKQDIDREKKKKGLAHHNSKIKRFIYAVPDYLSDYRGIPNNGGLISVSKTRNFYNPGEEYTHCRIIKSPSINSKAIPISDGDRLKLLHLGCMRIWTLKKKLNQQKHK